MFLLNKKPIVFDPKNTKYILKKVSEALPDVPTSIPYFIKNEEKEKEMAQFIFELKSKILADKHQKYWCQYKSEIDSFLEKLHLLVIQKNYDRFINLIDPENDLSDFANFLADSIRCKIY